MDESFEYKLEYTTQIDRFIYINDCYSDIIMKMILFVPYFKDLVTELLRRRLLSFKSFCTWY